MYTAILSSEALIFEKLGGFWLAVSFFINWYECFSSSDSNDIVTNQLHLDNILSVFMVPL